MSAFSASKVVPECSLSSSPLLLITQITKNSMDPPPSLHPDLLIKPGLHHPQNFIPDDKIKPLILIFDEKIKFNHPVISKNTTGDSPQSNTADDENIKLNHSSVISCNVVNTSSNPAADNDQKGDINSTAYQSAAAEGELWPKLRELDDRPSSPDNHRDATKQVIGESAYLFPKQAELNDRPQSPDSDAASSKCRLPQQVISKPAYQASAKKMTEQDDGALSYSNLQSAMKQGQAGMQVIRDKAAAYQSRSSCTEGAKRDEYTERSLGDDEHVEKPKEQVIRESAYQSPPHDTLSVMIKESYRTSARGRLSRVVEESESFSRREFGANVLNYMSTHSSANHAANLSDLYPKYKNYSNFSSNTHVSYYSRNQPDNFTTSKSAPAGSAARSGSTFAFFRRGASEGGHLARRGAVCRRQRSRKQRSIGSRLLWPLLKIRNGYVGCMMGLEGTGDLSGMAQGGTYATTSRYFADDPLSKIDSRNYG